ncbi:WD40 repeat domain-containing protein [Candidatus Dependentiae bacterium]
MNCISKTNKNKLSSIIKFGILGLGLIFSGSSFSMDNVVKISRNNLSLQELSYNKIKSEIDNLLSLSSKDLYKLISGDLKTPTDNFFTTFNTSFNNESDRHFMYLIREEVKKNKPEIFNLELLRKTFKHDYCVSSAVFSPDSRFILTASDKIVKLWNIKTGILEQTLNHNGHCCRIDSAIFSPDSKFILTIVSFCNRVNVWDRKTRVLKKIFKYDDRVKKAIFSPNGKYILIASGTIVTVWNTKTWSLEKTLNHDRYVDSVVFSSDGKSILTTAIGNYTYNSNVAKLWDMKTWTLKKTFHDYYLKDTGFCAFFFPDDKSILTRVYDDKYIAKLWDTETGKYTSKNYCIFSPPAFSPDGNSFLTVSLDKAQLHDTKTGVLKNIFKHSYDVNSAVFSPDGKFILTASCDNTAKLWQIPNKKSLNNLYSFKEILFLLLLSKEKSNLFKSEFCTDSFREQAKRILKSIDTSPLFSEEENKRLKEEGFIRKSILFALK